jgi:hypothetical protein
MFIRSSTATNDRLIALDTIANIGKTDTNTLKKLNPNIEFLEQKNIFLIFFTHKDSRQDKDDVFNELHNFQYKSEEDRDKAFEELCAFLNSNYKLRDFT